MASLTRGISDSVPIALGYLPIAFSFGLSALDNQVSAGMALLMSSAIFAGGSQFMLLGLLSAGGTVFGMFCTILLINARHLLYSTSVQRQLPDSDPLPKPLLAFGLTDEVFARASQQLSAIAPQQRSRWLLGLQIGAYTSWVLGTVAGVVIGRQLISHYPQLQHAFNFVLPALFFTLLLQLDWRRYGSCMVFAAGCFLMLSRLIPMHFAMPISIVLASLASLGCPHAKQP